ncbi:MAG TPA: hypothetical protein DIC60_08245 [Lachnospiraceae bacterium]|nr:hypothetical protein [Lachnospiraceae bacterium]
MVVTSVEQQKKNLERYNVFIDGEFAFGLIMEDILFFKIKEGNEISEEKYDYIKDTVVYIKAQNTALKYLGYKMRTEKEIKDKLIEKEYDDEIIGRVLEFLRKYNYVDDLKYAQSYIKEVQRLNPKGSYAIKHKLRENGVCDNVISEALEDCDLDEEEGAERLLGKKLGERRQVSYKEKKKLHDFLLRRGYSYAIIKKAFDSLEIELEKTAYDDF